MSEISSLKIHEELLPVVPVWFFVTAPLQIPVPRICSSPTAMHGVKLGKNQGWVQRKEKRPAVAL